MNGSSLADPGGGSSLVAALSWVQGTLLGTVATIVGVIAIAAIGLMMLGGRLDVRHGVRTIAGLFILFGASAIATGLMNGLRGISEMPPPPAGEASTVELQPPAPATNSYDPYAGVSALPAGPQWSEAEPTGGAGQVPKAESR